MYSLIPNSKNLIFELDSEKFMVENSLNTQRHLVVLLMFGYAQKINSWRIFYLTVMQRILCATASMTVWKENNRIIDVRCSEINSASST